MALRFSFWTFPTQHPYGKEKLHQRLLQDTGAGIPQQFKFIHHERLWYMLAKL